MISSPRWISSTRLKRSYRSSSSMRHRSSTLRYCVMGTHRHQPRRYACGHRSMCTLGRWLFPQVYMMISWIHHPPPASAAVPVVVVLLLVVKYAPHGDIRGTPYLAAARSVHIVAGAWHMWYMIRSWCAPWYTMMVSHRCCSYQIYRIISTNASQPAALLAATTAVLITLRVMSPPCRRHRHRRQLAALQIGRVTDVSAWMSINTVRR